MVDNKGFTLVELIVVVVIIGILASIAVSAINNLSLKSQGTEAIALLSHLRTTTNLYFLEHGTITGFEDKEWDSARNSSKYYGPGYKIGASSEGYATVKIYGNPGSASAGQWVEMDRNGTIRASYNGDESVL